MRCLHSMLIHVDSKRKAQRYQSAQVLVLLSFEATSFTFLQPLIKFIQISEDRIENSQPF